MDPDGVLLMTCCIIILQHFTYDNKKRFNELMGMNFFSRRISERDITMGGGSWRYHLHLPIRSDRLIKAEFKGYILLINHVFKDGKLPSSRDFMKYPLATALNKYFDKVAKESQIEHYPYDEPKTNLVVYCCDAILTDKVFNPGMSIYDGTTMLLNFGAEWKGRPLALRDREAYFWYIGLFHSTAPHSDLWREIKRKGIILLSNHAFRDMKLPINEYLMKEPAKIVFGKYFDEVAKEKGIDVS
ncbi:hypothetical protein MMC14_005825 [Varicellaria rhodocarpa]|nr:hypothetical protein [Varicellaria rhodocarpa]